jgi:hypothetical protein
MFPQQQILGTSSLFVLQLSELSNEFETPVSRQSLTGSWSCMCVLGGGLAHNSYSELCLFSNSCYLHLCLYVAVVTDILKPLKRYIGAIGFLVFIPDLVEWLPWQVHLSFSFGFCSFLSIWKKEQTQWFMCVCHVFTYGTVIVWTRKGYWLEMQVVLMHQIWQELSDIALLFANAWSTAACAVGGASDHEKQCPAPKWWIWYMLVGPQTIMNNAHLQSNRYGWHP